MLLRRWVDAGGATDGRVVMLLTAGVYLAMVALFRLVAHVDIWPQLGVPTGPSTFFDTRNIMAALECRRLDLDPLVENPCDPWGRPMVYPRVWLALRFLGLDQSHTNVFAIALILLFLLSFYALLGRITLGEGTMTALAICSPAVMLAVERANMDLAIFVILTSAVLIWRRMGNRRDILAPALVFLAAVAKVYPVFALAAFPATLRRRATVAASVCFVAFVGYAVMSLDDLQTIAERAPQGEYYSYGARILLARFFHLVVPEAWEGGTAITQLLAAIPVAGAALATWLWVRRRIRWAASDEPARLLAFHLGSLLYLGTFVLSNNFDYRLVFVLLTMPQLFSWIRDEGLIARLAGGCLTSALVLLWVGALSPYVAATDEIASWATAGFLGSLVAASIPPAHEMKRSLVRRRGAESAAGRA